MLPAVLFDATPPLPTITFDEDVTGFELADTIPTAGEVLNFATVTPGRVFTVDLQGFDLLTAPSPTAPAGAATDVAGNLSQAAPPPPDGVAPVVTITGVPHRFDGPQTAIITFDWGENVANLRDDDITVTGGTLGPISGGFQV